MEGRWGRSSARPDPGQEPGCQAPNKLVLELNRDPVDQQVTRIADNFQRPKEAGLHYIVQAQMRAEVKVVPPGCEGDAAGQAGAGANASMAAAASPAATNVKDPEPTRIDLMIAQHGIVAAMPSTLGGKALTHDVSFYDSSGALKSYALISKALVDKGVVESLSSSADTLVEARNKQREAEAEAADPVARTKEQAELLDALVKIEEACAKLENPPEECEQ